IVLAKFPGPDVAPRDEQAERDVAALQAIIQAARAIRSEHEIKYAVELPVTIRTSDERLAELLKAEMRAVRFLVNTKGDPPIAARHVAGDEPPVVDYTDAEHGVWKTVWAHLDPLHTAHACPEFFEGAARIAVDKSRIPQLRALNETLEPLTGFKLVPVAGLVT